MLNDILQKLETSHFYIIDAHAHLGHLSTFDIQGGDIDDLIHTMDRIGIDQIAIAPHLGLKFDSQRSNDYTAAAMEKYPTRIIGMATLNPNRPWEIKNELIRCFDQLGMSVIKLHPSEANCPMDRSEYQYVYDFASERSLPILNHDWESVSRLEKLSQKYPNINFLQAHNGGNWNCHYEDPYFELVRECGNVYFDICASPISYNSLELLLEKLGTDHVVFGTDAPFLNFAYGLGKVLYANITDEIKQKIFSKNYLKFLGKEILV